MSLLPVPLSPATCQLSSMRYWSASSRNERKSGGPPASPCDASDRAEVHGLAVVAARRERPAARHLVAAVDLLGLAGRVVRRRVHASSGRRPTSPAAPRRRTGRAATGARRSRPRPSRPTATPRAARSTASRNSRSVTSPPPKRAGCSARRKPPSSEELPGASGRRRSSSASAAAAASSGRHSPAPRRPVPIARLPCSCSDRYSKMRRRGTVKRRAETRDGAPRERRGVAAAHPRRRAPRSPASGATTGTSIALVSERSGLPASSIYWHFEDKDALIAAVIERSFEPMARGHERLGAERTARRAEDRCARDAAADRPRRSPSRRTSCGSGSCSRSSGGPRRPPPAPCSCRSAADLRADGRVLRGALRRARRGGRPRAGHLHDGHGRRPVHRARDPRRRHGPGRSTSRRCRRGARPSPTTWPRAPRPELGCEKPQERGFSHPSWGSCANSGVNGNRNTAGFAPELQVVAAAGVSGGGRRGPRRCAGRGRAGWRDGRAPGWAAVDGAGTGSVGPARWAATAARGTSSRWRPPAARASRTATAATRPVAGSAIGVGAEHGPSPSHATSPPATAASSPKATQSRAGPSRPWPVIDNHARGPPPASSAAASMPSCSSARGRDASITTSALATSARSATTPPAVVRSSGDAALAAR